MVTIIKVIKDSIFIKDIEEYKQELLPYKEGINGYIEAIARIFNKRIEDVRDDVVLELSEMHKEPIVKTFKRDIEIGDKHEVEIPLSKYLNSIVSEGLIIAPTGTAYTKKRADGTPWVSTHSKWTRNNMLVRAKIKEEAKEAYANNDMETFVFKNVAQKAYKIKNNSLSGLYALLFYPISTMSSHPTLTSTTRTVSGIGNIVSERMVSGNRLYLKPQDVYSEFMGYINGVDDEGKEKIQKVIDKYGLYIPTIDEIVEVVTYSSNLYFKKRKFIRNLRKLLATFTDVEKAIVVYGLDLYHLNKFNKQLVTTMLLKISTPSVGITKDIDILDGAHDGFVNLLHHVLNKELKGKGKNYKKMDANTQDLIASSAYNIASSLVEYQDIIEAFFKITTIPVNVSSLKKMVRRAIVLSDTDSTCATYFKWGKDALNVGHITNELISIGGAVLYFVTEATNNLLRQMCCNMNMAKDKWGVISMKPEYTWDVFIPANGSKHYVTNTIIKELLVLSEEQIDKDGLGVSGVSLIAGKIPKEYQEAFHDLINKVRKTLITGEKLSVKDVINDIINLEKTIITKLQKGGTEFFAPTVINKQHTYKNKDWKKSNYKHIEIYKRVFEETYGRIDEAPIVCSKISLKDMDTTSRMKTSLANMPDGKVKDEFTKVLLEDLKAKSFNTLYFPTGVLNATGVPTEVLNMLDYRKTITLTLKPIYTFMEMLGVFRREDSTYLELYKPDDELAKLL